MGRHWNLGGGEEPQQKGGDKLFADPPADARAPRPDDDWLLRGADPQRVVNRRWRRTRPGDLHPRRRADDHDTPPSEPASSADFFDPASLFRDPQPATPTAASTDGRIEPWASLGLTSTASWSEVVSRHRELAKLHHPDRAGTDPDDTRDAASRMAAINGAFAELGKIYKLSGDR
jgi:hypothetical protein